MQQRSLLGRIIDMIRDIIAEIRMNIELSLPKPSLETRLRWLRHTYYNDPDVNHHYRRVKEVLREHVDKDYQDYYERFLSAERSAYHIVKMLPKGVPGDDLMEEMKNLGDKIAHQIEQAQQVERALKSLPESAARGNVEQSYANLMQQLEESLTLHAGIPAQLLTFTTTRGEFSIDKMKERVSRLTAQLDDIAGSYDEAHSAIPEYERWLRENRDEGKTGG